MDNATSEVFQNLILDTLDGLLDSDTKIAEWVKNQLHHISCVFTNRTRNQKLLLACQWLYESYSGKNKLLAFVQTTIVLEILLGDKATSDQMGLSVLLRNRCAYLIGSTHSQRNEILIDFQKIYNVRSKIVHSGKSRLSYEEETLFRKLQWMCIRVIQEEVKLLVKDLKEDE